MLMPNRAYNELADEVKGAKSLKVDKGHTVIVHRYLNQSGNESQANDTLEVTVGGQSLKLQVDGVISQAVLNHDARIPYVLIMDDGQYEQLQEHIPSEQKYRITVMNCTIGKRRKRPLMQWRAKSQAISTLILCRE